MFWGVFGERRDHWLGMGRDRWLGMGSVIVFWGVFGESRDRVLGMRRLYRASSQPQARSRLSLEKMPYLR